MANFIGSTLNIPNVGTATVTGLTQFTNTPGFSISTDKGNYVYYDTSYVNQGLLSGGQQYISPGLLPYIQRKEAVEVDLSSYQDAFKSTKKGIPISGNGYLFTNPEADNVAPWIFGITEDIRPLNAITSDASGNLSYVGTGPYRNGSYNSYLQSVDGGLLRLQTDTKYKTGGGGILGGISDFLGTSGSGGGILGGLAKIDPGPAIGSGLAEADKFVNREIPGGYVLPAALALAAATGYVDPSLFATQAAGTAAGGTAAGTGLTAGAGASGGLLASGGTVGSLAGAGSAAGITATQAAAGLGIAAGSALPALGMATGGLPSTVGSLSPALPSAGSVGGAGAGLSAELAPGTILGSGLQGGGSIGASYALGANNLPATGLLGQPIPASSIGFGDIPSTVTAGLNISPKDVLDIAKLGSQVMGGQPQQPASPVAKPQSIIPRGQVDYSGILNLLQTRSPQRNIYSLLG